MTTWASGVPLRVGGSGTVFRITIKDPDEVVIDISAASSKSVKFRAPDGTVSTKAGSFTTDGTDGQLQYSDTDGSLQNVEGRWKLWGVVVIASKTYISTPLQYAVEAEGEG